MKGLREYEEWIDVTAGCLAKLIYLAVLGAGLGLTLGAVYLLERCIR